MIDPKIIRADLALVAQRLATRGFKVEEERINHLETKRKDIQINTQYLQNERNVKSKQIGQLKSKGEDATELMESVNQINTALKKAEHQLEMLQNELNEIYLYMPNMPHHSVPVGDGELGNQEVRRVGQVRDVAFKIRDHVDLGAHQQGLDFDTAVKITGARFVVMRGPIARLHRALAQFMLDTHTEEHGYTEVNVPTIVNADSLRGTGNLPKFEADLFALKGEQAYYLIPTAEVPVTNFLRDAIVEARQLPLKFVAHTQCYRSEAGSYGKDTRGIIRQHQFEKVELVQFAHPDHSYTALEELTHHAEVILQKLELPYRVMALCSGDMGFSAAKTYDLEVWLPGQQKYREISSCSNFEAFQARRIKARFRSAETQKPEILHTLNGSGLAVGRALVAVLENYQQENGQIAIPKILHPYMNGLQKI